MKKFNKTPLTLAMGTTAVISGFAANVNAEANPFAMSELSGGYMVAEASQGSCGGNVTDASGHKITGAKKGDSSKPANPILQQTDAGKGGWYWIEVLPYDQSSKTSGVIVGGSGATNLDLLPLNLKPHVVYRITALAQGLKPNSRVVLQQTYARQITKD